MILRMKTLPLDEARDFAHILEKIAKPHAPTLLKYTNHTDQEVKVHSDLKKIADFYLFNGGVKSDFSEKGVKMHKFDDIDDPIIAGLFFTHSDYDFSSIKKTVEKMSKKEKMEVLSTAQAKYKKHFESPMREFELGNMKYVFEIQTSASGFAQHKRQRMNTILTQRYNPALGVVIPPSISGSGLEKELREVTDASSELHIELYEAGIKRHAAEYALTNAHKRRILLGANMRQILQIANNREDAHAQWEIRQHISSIDDLLRKKSLSAAFACGKDVSEGISEIFRVSYCK